MRILLGAAMIAGWLMSGQSEAAQAWETLAPSDAGFEQDVCERVDRAFDVGKLDGLHGVALVRHGKLVAERYYRGVDESWGVPLGNVQHGPDTLHDLRSVSKSVVGLLYGIALSEGLVPALDAPVLDSFPEYEDLAADPDRRRITVAHALTMSMGLEWSEDLPYSDPHNSEIAMEIARDRYRYVLERPIVDEPGTRWVYSGGSTAIVARLIEIGSGQDLRDFAKERLFAPLGIEHFDWTRGRDGRAAAASGLRLTLRDLAKIGRLVLDGGQWDGEEVVPEDWLVASFEPRLSTGGELDYGYQWWLGTGQSSGKPWIGAFGNGGQRLFLVPHLDIAIAVNAGRYNQADDWKLPVSVIVDYLLPAFKGP